MSYNLEDVGLSINELQFLAELDSCQFGFLNIAAPKNLAVKALIKTGIRVLQEIIMAAQESDKNVKTPTEEQEVVIKMEVDTDEPTKECSSSANSSNNNNMEQNDNNSENDIKPSTYSVINSNSTTISADSNKSATNMEIDPKTYCKLGHLHLLLEEFEEALSAYQKYYNTYEKSWSDLKFLYGIGMVYFHFNAYNW